MTSIVPNYFGNCLKTKKPFIAVAFTFSGALRSGGGDVVGFFAAGAPGTNGVLLLMRLEGFAACLACSVPPVSPDPACGWIIA